MNSNPSNVLVAPKLHPGGLVAPKLGVGGRSILNRSPRFVNGVKQSNKPYIAENLPQRLVAPKRSEGGRVVAPAGAKIPVKKIWLSRRNQVTRLANGNFLFPLNFLRTKAPNRQPGYIEECLRAGKLDSSGTMIEMSAAARDDIRKRFRKFSRITINPLKKCC